MLKHGKTLPMIYIMLANKSQESYERMLELLKGKITSELETISVQLI